MDGGSVRRRIPGCATDQRDGRKAGLEACGMCGPRASRARQTAQGCAGRNGKASLTMACMFSRYDLLRVFPDSMHRCPEAGRLVSSGYDSANAARTACCPGPRSARTAFPSLLAAAPSNRLARWPAKWDSTRQRNLVRRRGHNPRFCAMPDLCFDTDPRPILAKVGSHFRDSSPDASLLL